MRTLHPAHKSRGSFLLAGRRAIPTRYTEGGAYVDNMQRLLRKFETAKSLVPALFGQDAERPTRFGAILFSSTSAAMREAHMVLQGRS